MLLGLSPIAQAATWGSGVVLPPAPTFVSATPYVTGTSDATTWTPFTGLDMSDCAMAIVVIAKDGTGNGEITVAAGSTAGWTAFGTTQTSTAAVASRLFYRLAPTSSETLVIDWGSGSETQQGSCIMVRLNGADTISSAGVATGSSIDANPPSRNSGTVRNYLWLAGAAWDAIITPSAGPSTYDNFTVQAASGANGASCAIATKSIDASQTEDPGAFTSDTEQWVAWTIPVYKA